MPDPDEKHSKATEIIELGRNSKKKFLVLEM
jgi:hypothetical protein